KDKRRLPCFNTIPRADGIVVYFFPVDERACPAAEIPQQAAFGVALQGEVGTRELAILRKTDMCRLVTADIERRAGHDRNQLSLAFAAHQLKAERGGLRWSLRRSRVNL